MSVTSPMDGMGYAITTIWVFTNRPRVKLAMKFGSGVLVERHGIVHCTDTPYSLRTPKSGVLI